MGNLQDVDMSDAGELNEGFKVIPPGDYSMYMESSERKTTKAGTGEYLECVFRVANTEHEGAKLFARFNLWNPSPTAVQIAKDQWRALCEATLGQPTALNNESSSLHNKLFLAEVEAKQDKDKPEIWRNELVFRKGKIRSMTQANAAVAQTGPAPSTAPAQTTAAPAKAAPAAVAKPGTGKPPWQK